MKAVIQRVKAASVSVDGNLVAQIGKGILVFAAVGKDDTPKDVESLASKVIRYKIWEDDKGSKWKRSVQDIEGEILCVSQFTLLATTKKGTKPDFHKSAAPDQARTLYKTFFEKVQSLYDKDKVKDGIFQAMMDVQLINDGPVGVDFTCEDQVVTLEFDTAPPKMEFPGEVQGDGPDEGGMQYFSGGKTYKLEDLINRFAEANKDKDFVIPEELRGLVD